MLKSRGLLPTIIILLGVSLLACGVFTAIPTLTPTFAPAATLTAVPVVRKAATVTAKPEDTATVPPLPAPTNVPTETPTGLDGQTLLVQRCNVCHSANVVTRLRGTADQWAGLVDVMVQNGADLSPQEEKVLAAYLAQKYH